MGDCIRHAAFTSLWTRTQKQVASCKGLLLGMTTDGVCAPDMAGPGLDRRTMSYGRLSSLGNAAHMTKLTRPASYQKFAILSELEKGEV